MVTGYFSDGRSILVRVGPRFALRFIEQSQLRAVFLDLLALRPEALRQQQTHLAAQTFNFFLRRAALTVLLFDQRLQRFYVIG